MDNLTKYTLLNAAQPRPLQVTPEDGAIIAKNRNRIAVFLADREEAHRVLAKTKLANSVASPVAYYVEGFALPGWANRCIVELETDGAEFRVDSYGAAEVVWP